jgi:hypothetical protein
MAHVHTGFFEGAPFFCAAHGRSGMAESVLQPHRQEIARLYFEERNTQVEIIRYLQQAHGIQVNRSTLSRFLQSLPEAKQPPQPGDPGVSPEAERFLEQAEVYQKLQEASATLLVSMPQLLARMGILEDAARERHDAVGRAFHTMQENASASRDSVLAALRHQEETRRSAVQGMRNLPRPHDGDSNSHEGDASLKIPLEVLTDEIKRQGRDLEAIRRSLGMPASGRPRWESVKMWSKALLIAGLAWAIGVAVAWRFWADILAFFRRF